MLVSPLVPVQPAALTSEECFAQRVDQTIHEQCRISADHCLDRYRTQVLWQQINLEHQHATWLLYEHVRNEDYIYREGVPIWSQAQFRYSLWRLHRNRPPMCVHEKTVRVARLSHRWSIFQRKPWRWITDDLFAIMAP